MHPSLTISTIFLMALIFALSGADAQESGTKTPTVPPATSDTSANSSAELRLEDDPSEKEVHRDTLKAIQAKDRPTNLPDDTSVYTRPLRFTPEDNGVKLQSPQLKWDMSAPNQINMGGLIINTSEIGFRVDQIPIENVPRDLIKTAGPRATVISFNWPKSMLQTGTVEIVDRNNKPLWSKIVSLGEREFWSRTTQRKNSPVSAHHRGAQYGVVDIPTAELPILSGGQVFRSCIRQKVTDEEQIRICTGLLRIDRSAGGLKLQRGKSEARATVYLEDTEIGANGIVNFPPGKTIEMKIMFNSGATISFSSGPMSLDLIDAVLSKGDSTIVLLGQGVKPIGRVKDVIIPANHFWSETGIKRDVIWRLEISTDTPLVRVLGAWNIPFIYLLTDDGLPREEDRVFISQRTGSGTYKSEGAVYGLTPQGDAITSKENSAKMRNKQEFIWKFRAKQKGELNKSHLLVNTSGKEKRSWSASYELYRGYPIEASARLSGIATASLKTVLLGEVAGSWYFENLGFTDDYYISHQRWGIASRYFRALSSIDLGEGNSVSEFNSLNLDLRYNLIPGIWNRDEIFGLTLGSQQINFGGINALMLGTGAYWARTMPKVFDKVFNILSIFRYPKYVDMEFAYYPMSISSGITAGQTYTLNFHGKVFWAKTFYGEAGFGIKQYDYIETETETAVSFGTAFGTVGLGFIF